MTGPTYEQKIAMIEASGGIPPAFGRTGTMPKTEEPVNNPYLELFLQYMQPSEHWGWERKAESLLNESPALVRYSGPRWEKYLEASMEANQARHRLVAHYAWAVPNETAIDAIAELGPIVEVGAGTGYWASLIRARGVNVQAFDRRKHLARTFYADRTAYAPMAVGDEYRAMRMYPTRTLFLCWPPNGTPMAYNAARLTKAERLVYVGEILGCTADDAFHRLIDEAPSRWFDEGEPPPEIEPMWEKEHEVDIPQWYGMHDYLTVYKRIK